MRTDDPIYIDFTPIDLWRLGVKNSSNLDRIRITPPRPPTARIDIHTYLQNGETWVGAGTGGISLFDGKNPRLSGDCWWRIPANTPIPEELEISKNHTDRETGITHFRVQPRHNMPLKHFICLLSAFARYAERDFIAFNKVVAP